MNNQSDTVNNNQANSKNKENVFSKFIKYERLGIVEFITSFLSIFSLAIYGIKYPLMSLFNSSSKGVDKAYNKVKNIGNVQSDNVMIEKKESALSKLYKEIENKLGISQREREKLENERHLLQKELESADSKRTTTAKIYIYKVKDRKGKIITGRFTGFSKLDVNSFLLNEGYEVYKIENSKWIDFVYGDSAFLSSKWSNKDLIFWLTQLATYIKSGITLNESIKILMNQMGKNRSKKVVMQSIAYELTMGNSFSKALEKQAGVFPSLLINMLKAAEATGELEETLEDMANYYTEIESTRKEMVSAMTYPVLVTVFALVVIVFIILYLIPQFSNIYESSNIEITGLTKFLLNASEFLKKYISFIIIGVFMFALTFYFTYKKIKAFRREVQIIAMKLPVFGKIIIYNEITIFTKTFSSLLKNNVYITESIDILSKITNNEIYKEIMFTTINNIASGNKISDAFQNHWAVPGVAYYMIVTGESTGELAQMMDRVSQYYQEQHRSIINNLKAILEPVMIVTLAVIVGAIIIAVIVPMFQMYDAITG